MSLTIIAGPASVATSTRCRSRRSRMAKSQSNSRSDRRGAAVRRSPACSAKRDRRGNQFVGVRLHGKASRSAAGKRVAVPSHAESQCGLAGAVEAKGVAPRSKRSVQLDRQRDGRAGASPSELHRAATLGDRTDRSRAHAVRARAGEQPGGRVRNHRAPDLIGHAAVKRPAKEAVGADRHGATAAILAAAHHGQRACRGGRVAPRRRPSPRAASPATTADCRRRRQRIGLDAGECVVDRRHATGAEIPVTGLRCGAARTTGRDLAPATHSRRRARRAGRRSSPPP